MPQQLRMDASGKATPVQAAAAAGPASPVLKREAPKWLIAVAAVLLLGFLGATGFYVWNGGWKTKAQLQYEYQHELFPILAYRRGMTEPLEEENARRKRLGLPLLQPPHDRSVSAAQTKQQLQQLRQQLEARMGKGGAASQ